LTVAVRLDLREDVRSTVVESRGAEQDAREVHGT
jgi:hypothetical protein